MSKENKLVAVCCDPDMINGEIVKKFPTIEQFCNEYARPVKAVTETVVKREGNPIAYYGCSGAIVAAIQGALCYWYKLGNELNAEWGKWGTLTDFYMHKFQREHGLSPDGIAGANTYGKLFTII